MACSGNHPRAVHFEQSMWHWIPRTLRPLLNRVLAELAPEARAALVANAERARLRGIPVEAWLCGVLFPDRSAGPRAAMGSVVSRAERRVSRR
jgi:hypothetical protein